MPKPKSNQCEYGVKWYCSTCDATFNHEDMMKHIKEVHGIDVKTTKGNRRMKLHVDGADFFASEYEWEINKVFFQQTVCTKRTGEDAAYWDQECPSPPP
jgi:hypothetical protein